MSIRKMIVLLSVAVSLLVAFHPPVDTAGPLTAKIEGPAKITQATNPEQFSVVLENSADAAIQGTVRAEGIDGWRVQPGGAVPFAVAGKSSARLAFTITPAAVTYNAFYPIHAFVEFESQGVRQTAHPILMMPVQLANQPGPDLPPDLKPRRHPRKPPRRRLRHPRFRHREHPVRWELSIVTRSGSGPDNAASSTPPSAFRMVRGSCSSEVSRRACWALPWRVPIPPTS